MEEKLTIIAEKMVEKLDEILDQSETSENRNEIAKQIENLDLKNITDLNIDRIK